MSNTDKPAPMLERWKLDNEALVFSLVKSNKTDSSPKNK